MATIRAHVVIFLTALGTVLALSSAFPVPPLDVDAGGSMALWFRSLRQPGTDVSCCDEADCRQTIARRLGEEWVAQTPDGQWTMVPPALVLNDKAHPAGIAVLCWRPAAGVVCFIPPRYGG